MKLFGLAGWSGSGKTTLLVRLLPALIGHGLTVSTVKHAHHDFDTDRPGKDSYEHRAAGAAEVLVSSARRWALVHEHRGAPEPVLAQLVARLSPVDLVLVEGFKSHPHDKLEVHRRESGQPFLYEKDPRVVAIATDHALHGLPIPVFALDNVEAIARFIVRHCGLDGAAAGRP